MNPNMKVKLNSFKLVKRFYKDTQMNPAVISGLCELIHSPLFTSLLVSLPPVQTALSVQQVHVAAGPLLLTAYHSEV